MKTRRYFRQAVIASFFFIAASTIFLTSLPAYAVEYYEVSLNSLTFSDTDIQKVLEIFSVITKTNIFLDESVPKKKVTFFAQNMQPRIALEMFAKTNGLLIKKMNQNTYLLFPRAKAAEYESDAISHVFILENDDPKKIINILKTIGKSTKVSLNERINGIVMIDTPENIEVAKRIVSRMDYKKPQVSVDLKLVEIKRDRLKDLGIKFKEDYFLAGDLKTFITPQSPTLVDTLIKENAAEVLAQPKLKVLDQQKAEIEVGDKIPIEITSSSKTASGDNIQLTKTVQWERVGIKLQVQVEKIHNHDEVTLKIYNEVSSVVEYTKEGYPHIRTRNAVTVVRLNSNETAVIGGLINSEERTTIFKIPLLSKLPGLGAIFRNVKTDKISTEIVMFITPTISCDAKSGDDTFERGSLQDKVFERSSRVTETSDEVMEQNLRPAGDANAKPDAVDVLPSLGVKSVSEPVANIIPADATVEIKIMPDAPASRSFAPIPSIIDQASREVVLTEKPFVRQAELISLPGLTSEVNLFEKTNNDSSDSILLVSSKEVETAPVLIGTGVRLNNDVKVSAPDKLPGETSPVTISSSANISKANEIASDDFKSSRLENNEKLLLILQKIRNSRAPVKP